MARATHHLLLSSGIIVSLVTWLSVEEPYRYPSRSDWTFAPDARVMPPDTTDEDDSLRNVKYKSSRRPTYKLNDRYGDRFNNRSPGSPLLLKTPSNIKTEFEADSAGNVTIHEKAGAVDYRPPTTMSFEQFNKIQDRQVLRNYWRSKAEAADGKSEVSNKRIIPKIYAGPVIDRLFGGSYIDFQPTGFVNLDFAGRFQRIDNPSIPVRQQRTGNFMFDQQASVNFTGKIGEKLKVVANYDTKASFNFENNIKLEYTASEEDIIQKVEIGNASLPLNSTLITGVQNLFGVRTQLKFGRLNVGLIAANQRSRTDGINVKGGIQTKNFEIRVDAYDENRHFFLSQFFRNKYESALRNLPLVSSGVNITRVEVYVTNRNNNTQTIRNVVGFADLGEPNPYNRANTFIAQSPIRPEAAFNGANGIFNNVTQIQEFRNVDRTNAVLENAGVSPLSDTTGFRKARDFELLRSARKLAPTEYSFHPQLGYISLTSPLRNDEILQVAYEYSLNGRSYKVGELTEDYSTRRDDEVIVLKLLKSSTLRNNTYLPMWNLMMKNIYSLNTTQINRQGFQLRIIYKDDLTGIDNPYLQEGRNLEKVPLVQVFGMDRLNPQLDPQVDGNFDFVEGITIDSQYGRVIFPVLEPFGSWISSTNLNNPFRFQPDESTLEAKYVFNTLYRTTQQQAAQLAAKNKFFIKGSFQSTASNEILLPGIGIDENSIRVTAGGVPLVPGQDYIVEAQLGRIRIINESILNSGREVKVDFEKPDLFNNQVKTLLGTRLDFEVSKDIRLGATLMRLRERPTLTRIGMGNEPVNNTIFGFDALYKKDSRFLTKMVDMLPFLQTKEVSTVTFAGEYAKLMPGVAPLAQNNSFIDDFEGSETPFDLTRTPTKWRLGATPGQFPAAKLNDRNYTNGRAKLSWYNIDNLFYRNGGQGTPEDITEADMKNHYVRGIQPQEIFANRANYQLNVNETTLDLAYYPAERGPYNYQITGLNPNGTFVNPRANWAAITRAITYDIDFDNSNVQYIEFWLMDPFIKGENGKVVTNSSQGANNNTGGKLYFNLGDISEDVMKDGRHAFENGLPTDTTNAEQRAKYINNIWGRVTKQQFLTNAFAANDRAAQDVGLDGINNENERIAFQDAFLGPLASVLSQEALQRVQADPSSDDFQYFLGTNQDGKKILERYKNYYGMEGNSPAVSGNEIYTPASSATPDNEDLNTDNTISDIEAYYQYEMDLKPGQLDKGRGYIVDKVTNVINGDEVNWYQFRIPIREYKSKVGNINGFKSIRFMRLFMTDWAEPVVLRMSQFQMVSNQWRAYQGDLAAKRFVEGTELYDAQFKVATVNIEANGQNIPGKTPYVLPPGFIRDRDISTINNRQLNEQSLRLSVTDLKDGDARAVFKNTTFDFINYKRLRMFVHAEPSVTSTILDGEVSAFLRVGTDFTENYYEVEVPLKVTPLGAVPSNCISQECLEEEEVRRMVWPLENEINVAFAELVNAKAERNNRGQSLLAPYVYSNLVEGRFKITVVGNPDLSSVQTIMIGVRNPKSPDQAPKSFTVWANELRASEFDQEGGYAAVGRLNVKLADFANITATGRIQTYGFGGIQQKISERARETTAEWGIGGNVALDKLLPRQLGLRIPLFASYEKLTVTPRFNPLDPDTRLDISLQKFGDNPELKEAYRKQVIDQTVKRSINFTNVQKVKTNPEANSHFYDISNLSFTYAYSDVTRSNVNIESYSLKWYKTALAYTFTNKVKPIEPFKNVKLFNSPYLKLIKDFNISLMPSTVTVRGDLDRQIIRTQLRSGTQGSVGILPTFEKYFTFNRAYDVRWNLSQNLALDYTAAVNAVVDEPIGDIDDSPASRGSDISKRDSLWNNFYNLGRMKNFNQRVGATYRLPLDKIPFTDWLNADVTYNAGYIWTASSYGIREDTTGTGRKSGPYLIGNTIQNSRDRGLTGKIDLVKLYNKIKFLKGINTPAPRRPPVKPDPSDTTRKEKPAPDLKALKTAFRLLMSMRSINFTYNIQEGTVLPGFLPTPKYLGMDNGFNAPGWDFVLGSQDQGIRERLGNQGVLSRAGNSPYQYTQNRTTNLSVQTTLEPFKDFRIQVTAKKAQTDEYRDFYRPDSLGNGPLFSQSPLRTGSYNISFISIGTAFKSTADPNNSETYQNFQNYRSIIQGRLRNESSVRSDTSFGRNSQDVLLGAFLAAYSGKDPSSMDLSPFPAIPLPNWRLDYAGLSKLESLKKIFSQINITHSYTSSYSIGNYTSSQQYGPGEINFSRQDYRRDINYQYNQQGQAVPLYIVSQASITERFAPLIGINVRTQSKITAKLEYNQERNLTLTLNNSQINEMSNKGMVIGLGYSKSGLKLPIKSQGRTIVLKNQVDFRFDLTIRDTRTIQRTPETTSSERDPVTGVLRSRSNPASNTITAGNINFQLKPTINYMLNERLNLQVYFERTVNEPLITSSFRRSTTTFGVQLRFNLAE